MLSERKLVDSLKTIVDLSQFIDIDGLKSAVRAIGKLERHIKTRVLFVFGCVPTLAGE